MHSQVARLSHRTFARSTYTWSHTPITLDQVELFPVPSLLLTTCSPCSVAPFQWDPVASDDTDRDLTWFNGYSSEISKVAWGNTATEFDLASCQSPLLHGYRPATCHDTKRLSAQQPEFDPQNSHRTSSLLWYDTACIDYSNPARPLYDHGYAGHEAATKRPLSSRKYGPDHRLVDNTTPARKSHELKGRNSKRSSKFVTEWFSAHASSPYPTKDQITALATLSGLSIRQVKVCLSNHRARTKDGMP